MKQLWLGLLATLITLPIPCQARPNQEGAYEVLGVGTISCEVWRTEPIRATIAILLMGLGFKATLLPLMSSAMVRAI